ncbi:hypothetical protein EIN_318340 [Entamoeba invadens IP1]|uniref:Uncharacterized protein n=1 Tax=Entamoeba invadens IP1 TaxID=370355 RepID=A0A0A1TZH2_ENTIV|nr:hypothetical protein EIN_318340 [Entamoeba invadens IP1]ELP86995.1 hypothetical protein EIN_318340 [Entamoeba invadens IP1]|eukprot:XP_004253766.1 hypothetical protein EIN_318340 [Entamoeba invadens IP1]
MTSESKEVTFTLEDLYKDAQTVSRANETIRRVSDNFKDNFQIILQLTLALSGLPIDNSETVLSEEYIEEKSFKDVADRLDSDLFKTPTNIQITVKKLWKGVWKNVCGVIKESSSDERKEYGKGIKSVHEIISSLSRSEIRNVRLSSSLCSVVMFEQYIETLESLNTREKVVKRSKNKKTKNEELDRLDKAINHVTKLIAHIRTNVLYPRCYDVSRDIRKVACETVLNDFNEEYDEKVAIVKDLLFDDDSHVRKAVTSVLITAFANTTSPPEDIYVELAKSVKDRIVEMRLDADVDTAKSAIELCSKLDEWGLITEADRKEMYRMLCDRSSKIRKQTALYLATFLKRRVEAFLKGKRQFVVKDKEKLRFVLIVRLLIEMVEKETDLPKFSYYALEYLIAEFEEFSNVGLLVDFLCSKESLALFETEDAKLYEGHENVLLGMLLSKVMRNGRKTMTVDEVLEKMSNVEKKKQQEDYLDVSEVVISRLDEIYQSVESDIEEVSILMVILRNIEKETILTENNLERLKNVLKLVSVKIREGDASLTHNYFAVLSDFNIGDYPQLQQVVSSVINDDMNVLCTVILDDGMNDETIEIKDEIGLEIIYQYIKVDSLPLLRERVLKLSDRVLHIDELKKEHFIVLLTLMYVLVWDKVENQTSNVFTVKDYFNVLYGISQKKFEKDNDAFIFFGVVCESYFLLNTQIPDLKIRVESIIDNFAIECNTRKFFKAPVLEDLVGAYDFWPIDALSSALSVVTFNKKVVTDISEMLPKMGPDVAAKLKKQITSQLNQPQPQAMELEDDPIEN